MDRAGDAVSTECMLAGQGSYRVEEWAVTDTAVLESLATFPCLRALLLLPHPLGHLPV
jgi:hypothetical protein